VARPGSYPNRVTERFHFDMPTIPQVKTGLRFVGQGIPRLDARDKVRGQTRFADDIPLPDLWYGQVVRSPVARGRLHSLRRNPAFDWSRVVVVTPDDIPGENVLDMFLRDMPVLAESEINYAGEPLALVAAPTRALAREAAARIEPEIEALPALLTLQDMVERYRSDRSSLDELAAYHSLKGNAEKALAQADRVIESEFWCGHQEHMYIEPQSVTAIPEGEGGILIEGSFQCPYYVTPALCSTLNIPPEKLRVRQSGIGGAFGGKEEFPVLMGGHSALLAMKCNRPVRMTMGRTEDVLYSPKRHPAWIRHRTGLTRDGTIAGMQVELILDGGGYTTISREVLYRATLTSGMGYRCEHVQVDGYVYRSHTPPNGAFRGFGTPQALWGQESHVDELAAACGLRPDAFRLQNCMTRGDTTPTGGVLREQVGCAAVLRETFKRSRFAERLGQCSRGRPGTGPWYGIGAGIIVHGQGFRGDYENKTKPEVAAELDFFDDGLPGVRLRVSSTEMGQGAHTVLPQIAADALSVDIRRVSCPYPDTGFVPNSGSTNASRTTMIVGHVVHGAVRKMKEALETFAKETFYSGQEVQLENGFFAPSWGGESTPFEEVAALYLKKNGPLSTKHVYSGPKVEWNEAEAKGDAYYTYTWGCNVAEVEVDPLTLQIKVRRVTATYDVGRIINPVTAKGQIEGALVQALGYAVMERLQSEDGRFTADRMQTYVIPTTLDIPELDLEFLNEPFEAVAPGAKGLGELAIDGLAPAVGNAVEQATGVRLRELPLTPEKLLDAIRKKESRSVA